MISGRGCRRSGARLAAALEYLDRSIVPYRNCNDDSDHNARQHGQCCLLVMLAGEQPWILQSAKRTHDGELGATQDGIGLEVAHHGA